MGRLGPATVEGAAELASTQQVLGDDLELAVEAPLVEPLRVLVSSR